MSIVELRQYTLHPGARETLIELFEREFVTGQQSAGITVGGRFRDLDDPDRFVWLRAFPDMEHRRRSLEAFPATTTPYAARRPHPAVRRPTSARPGAAPGWRST